MDLLAVLRIAARRWYLLVPLIILSVVASRAVYGQVRPSYEIEAVLPITAPYVQTSEAADRLGRNTFLDLRVTSSIMASLGDSADIRHAIEEQGGDPEYEIGSDAGVITVSVSTDSPERALTTYRLVGETLSVRLDKLQESTGAPPEFRVTINKILQPTGALISTSGRERAVIASLALGLVLSIAACVFVDYLLTRRRPKDSPSR